MSGIQRYRVNNCAAIADDKGGYCLAEDVEYIEKRHSDVIDSHIHIDTDEFKALATFMMCNDNPNQDADIDTVHSVLNQIAARLGYDDWVSAYHELG